ncbi:MAG TPA: hypothetical protein VJG64_01575 [Candidatus Paceibacterota bacterium]
MSPQFIGKQEGSLENFLRLKTATATFNELCEGRGFVIYVDLKDLLPDPERGEETAYGLGGDEILLRLEPVWKTMLKLRNLLLERKQVFNVEGRPCFDLKIPWTDEGIELLGRLEREIAEVDRYIRL